MSERAELIGWLTELRDSTDDGRTIRNALRTRLMLERDGEQTDAAGAVDALIPEGWELESVFFTEADAMVVRLWTGAIDGPSVDGLSEKRSLGEALVNACAAARAREEQE